jgi:hypothetical protein
VTVDLLAEYQRLKKEADDAGAALIKAQSNLDLFEGQAKEAAEAAKAMGFSSLAEVVAAREKLEAEVAEQLGIVEEVLS